jgi:uncharacterized protein
MALERVMIQINVSQFLKSPVGTERSYRISEDVAVAESNLPVQGEVSLTRSDRGILVKGVLSTETELTCSRCLKQFTCPLTLNIEEEYFPSVDPFTGAALPLPDEPGAFTIGPDNVLDLSEAIRQYALLSIPMKPLCREDCAGLCPTCGADLNEAPCGCPAKSIDLRWAKLIRLKQQD